MYSLEALGWNSFFAHQLANKPASGWIPARVVEEHKHLYTVQSPKREMMAEISGRLRFLAGSREDFPAVGDWVLVEPRAEESRATVHQILERKSKFSRKAAGNGTEEQIVAANIDRVFLVQSLNQDFNPRRMERYLTLIWESGGCPVILLNKCDLCPDAERLLSAAALSAPGVQIHAVSARTGLGMESVSAYLEPGHTIALLGSSGVGKSTIVNALAGRDLQRTRDIRESDGRGRHTTTSRQLIILSRGGILIDTPGMRELQLWDGESGLSRTFEDVASLAAQCHFSNCRHEGEPLCAIREALDSGLLSPERWASYGKIQAELRYLERKRDTHAMLKEKKRWKQIHKEMKRRNRRS